MPSLKPIRAEAAIVRNKIEAFAPVIAGPDTDANGTKLKTFTIDAYHGGPVSVGYYDYPVVMSIMPMDGGTGITARRRQIPIHADHDLTQLVGHANDFEKTETLVQLSGVMSGTGPKAQEILGNVANGVEYMASVGVQPTSAITMVEAGESLFVNGRDQAGPFYLVKSSELYETSMLTVGADASAITHIAAKLLGEDEMKKFTDWVIAEYGIDEAAQKAWSPAVRANFDAKYKAAVVAHAKGEEKAEPVAAAAAAAAAAKAEPVIEAVVLSMTESQFQDTIVKATAKATAIAVQHSQAVQAHLGDFPEIAAKAIAASWDEPRMIEAAAAANDKKELAAIKANPANNGFAGFSIAIDEDVDKRDVIEAAAYLALNRSSEEYLLDPYAGLSPELKAAYESESAMPISEAAIKAAKKMYPRGSQMGLQELSVVCADLDGTAHGRVGHYNGRQTIRASLGGRGPAVQGSFSTNALTTIYQSLVERKIIDNLRRSTLKWREVAATSSVTNFLQQDFFRVHIGGRWEKLNDGAELSHDTLSSSPAVSGRIDTEGKMLMLTRKDYENDYLGALDKIAEGMAYYGNLAPELGFWQTVYNMTLPGANVHQHANYAMTLANAHTAITLAYEEFCNMVDPNNADPHNETDIYLDIEPATVMGPKCNGWETTMRSFLKTNTFETLSTTGRESIDNIFKDQFTVIASNYLNRRPTAWYMMTAKEDIPVFRAMFLNGIERPTIESIEPRPEILGAGFRGWIDYGFVVENPEQIHLFDSDVSARTTVFI